MSESLMLRGGPFQTIRCKSLNDLLPNSVENCGISMKNWLVDCRVRVGV